MRLQLALNVRDLDEAVSYYRKLFDTPPHKLRPGYANFAVDWRGGILAYEKHPTQPAKRCCAPAGCP